MSERRAPAEAERRSVERLVFFTDAAVAIALTLLILPLMEDVGEATAHGADTYEYLADNIDPLISFVVSFVIIARYWRLHDAVFRHAEYEVRGLFALDMAWLLCIVFLPVATALIGSAPPDRVQYVVYIGTILGASLLLTTMARRFRADPSSWKQGHEIPASFVSGGRVATVLIAVALVFTMVFPAIGYLSLALLAFAGPITKLVSRRLLTSERPGADGHASDGTT